MEATLRSLEQFAGAMRSRFLAEQPGSEGDYDRHYPVSSRRGEWSRAIEAAVRGGAELDAETWDAIDATSTTWYRQLIHDYRRSLPAGYLPPSVRSLDRWGNPAPA